MCKWNKQIFALILYITLFNVQAAEGTSKDWAWDTSNPDYATALTSNDSDNIMGIWCYYEALDNQCIYIIDFNIRCKDGSEYPLLVNSDVGSTSMNVTCGHKYKDHNVMYASDFDAMDDIVNNAIKVGFVIPLEGDEFKAVRFSLAGSTFAIKMMLDDYMEKRNRLDNSKTRVNTKRSEEIF